MRKRTSDGLWLYSSLTLPTSSTDGGTESKYQPMQICTCISKLLLIEHQLTFFSKDVQHSHYQGLCSRWTGLHQLEKVRGVHPNYTNLHTKEVCQNTKARTMLNTMKIISPRFKYTAKTFAESIQIALYTHLKVQLGNNISYRFIDVLENDSLDWRCSTCVYNCKAISWTKKTYRYSNSVCVHTYPTGK